MIALLHIALHGPSDLFRVSKVKEAVFAQFWLRVGKTVPCHPLPCASFMITGVRTYIRRRRNRYRYSSARV